MLSGIKYSMRDLINVTSITVREVQTAIC